MTLDSIYIYLYYGYVPTYQGWPANILGGIFNRIEHENLSIELDITQLINRGTKALRTAFQDAIRGADEDYCFVLPLSGGLDSRAILAGLLENTDSRKIQAVTFGTPGTWDFEIGQQVARAAGVSCEPMDLTAENWKWRTEELVSTAVQIEAPVWVFDAHVNRAIAKRFGEEAVYWSGFMGDPLAGSHLYNEDSTTWEQAKSRFLVKNLYSTSTILTPPDFKPGNYLPSQPFSELGLLSYDEQLDFGIRQDCLIRHIVMPSGYNYRMPFLHPEWVGFILSVPRCYRKNKWLYKEILKAAYPKLFSLPTKTSYGLPLKSPKISVLARRAVLKANSIGRQLFPTKPWAVDPRLNYIDFDRGLRERGDLKTLVHENLHDLKRRGVVDWIDFDAIWQRHQQKQGNHSDALVILASLEINLKAYEI
jgi:hypothetical protein